MTSLDTLHYVVVHYLKYCFRPVTITGVNRSKFIIENGLHISFGRSFDHTAYCIWLAENAPNYGILVNSLKHLNTMRSYYRFNKWNKTVLPNQMQTKLNKLDLDTNILVILNASQFSPNRLKKILTSWPSYKPVIFIG